MVQGAVIYGVEKANYQNLVTMSTCSRSYGIVIKETYSVHNLNQRGVSMDPVTNNIIAQEQLTWLIRRGDLLLSDEHKKTEKHFKHNFLETDPRNFKFPVYEYPDDDDDVPERFETGENGK